MAVTGISVTIVYVDVHVTMTVSPSTVLVSVTGLTRVSVVYATSPVVSVTGGAVSVAKIVVSTYVTSTRVVV